MRAALTLIPSRARESSLSSAGKFRRTLEALHAHVRALEETLANLQELVGGGARSGARAPAAELVEPARPRAARSFHPTLGKLARVAELPRTPARPVSLLTRAGPGGGSIALTLVARGTRAQIGLRRN